MTTEIGGFLALAALFIGLFTWLRQDIQDLRLQIAVLRAQIADLRAQVAQLCQRAARIEGVLEEWPVPFVRSRSSGKSH